MPKNIIDTLKSIGLTKSEISIYLCLLELGPSPVQKIAQKTKLSRTGVYEGVEMLKKKNIVASQVVGKKQLLIAEDPAHLVSYVKAEQERLASTLFDMQALVDDLRLMSGAGRPIITSFEGNMAATAFFDHLAQKMPKEMREIVNTDDVYAYFSPEEIGHARHKVKKVYDQLSGKIITNNIKKSVEGFLYKKTPAQWQDFHGDMIILKDSVVFITFNKKPVTIIIENKIIAQMLAYTFDSAWNAL
jgi:sugar-specific transcriptional regulator TrmB